MERAMSCLFGPVPSRRYGRSLGIDLVPMKTCCYDCVFCQLGITPQTTCQRRDYIPLKTVLGELETWLASNKAVDMLTLCGSGEPTLHAHFGEVLRWIRANTKLPSLLMSNGALFADPEVRRDAAEASRVKISVHFWDEASFQATVRPHGSLHFADLVEGWRQFRASYEGLLDVEFFALPGMNDAPGQLDRVYALLETLRPDTVTVNSAARPPAESCVKQVPAAELAHLKAFFGSLAAARQAAEPAAPMPYSEAALQALARRHPLTPAQFSRYFGVPEAQIREALERLSATDTYAARALLHVDSEA
jgi:wyosine [tRNA(Phe)-imidazoG37] synthetase (radical SAM superfamily)